MPKKIVNADRTDNKVIVSYSDESTSVFSAEQLNQLTPEKEIKGTEGKEPTGK